MCVILGKDHTEGQRTRASLRSNGHLNRVEDGGDATA